MTNDVAAFLDAVETRAAAATPGPWLPHHRDEDTLYIEGIAYEIGWPGDAAFIIGARSDVPVLMAGWRKVLALCASGPSSGYLTPREVRAALVEAASPTRGGTDVPVS